MLNLEQKLPWNVWPWKRCKAFREPRPGHFWGQCELDKNHFGIDHALERGMDIPRWSTEWTRERRFI